MSDTCVAVTPPPNAGADGVSGGFGTQHEALRVTMALLRQCPDRIEVRATVSAVDPNNQPVDLVGEDATRVVTARDSNGMSTVIEVLPKLAGPYHFTARFEPNLGVVQADVLVAEDDRDAGPELTLADAGALAGCRHVDLTEQGRVLCLTGAVRVLERDGTLLQTVSASAQAARVGETLWVVASDGLLTRWHETDAGYAREDAGLSLALPNPLIAADEEGLLVAAESEVLHTSRADAGLERVGHPDNAFDHLTTVWRSGRQFAMVSEVIGAGGAAPHELTLITGALDGPPAAFAQFGSTLDGSGNAPAVGTLGSEPPGVWLVTQDLGTFPVRTLLTLNGRKGQRTMLLPFAWRGSFPGARVQWDTGASLVNDADERLYLLDRDGQFVLQRFPSLPLRSVTSRWLALDAPDGQLRIYRR